MKKLNCQAIPCYMRNTISGVSQPVSTFARVSQSEGEWVEEGWKVGERMIETLAG